VNIGEAAHASGISARMIRYYEAIGLIEPPKRRPSGYRQYELPDIRRLRLIRIARHSGFSFANIRDIHTLWEDRRDATQRPRSWLWRRLANSRRSALNRSRRWSTHFASWSCSANAAAGQAGP